MTPTKKARLSEMLPIPQAADSTGAVMTKTTPIDQELAFKAIDQIRLDAVCRDLGTVAAREYANVLDMYALRPSDFSENPEVPERIAAILVDYISTSEAFRRAFIEALRTRG